MYPLLVVMTTSVKKISLFVTFVAPPLTERANRQENLVPVALVIVERLATVGTAHASPVCEFLNFFGYEFRY
jgi:hypothetical protein